MKKHPTFITPQMVVPQVERVVAQVVLRTEVLEKTGRTVYLEQVEKEVKTMNWAAVVVLTEMVGTLRRVIAKTQQLPVTVQAVAQAD